MSSSNHDSQVISGQDFLYLTAGTGRTVLFVHGALGDVRTFAPHCRRLADRFAATTFTQRYFGTGHWPEQGPAFGVETHAADLLDFITAKGLSEVSLVGWSYSGHVALRALQLRPDLFARALIYETGFQTFMTDADAVNAFRADNARIFGPVNDAVKAGDIALAARHLVNGSAGDNGYFDAMPVGRRTTALENATMMPRLLSQTPPPKIRAADLAAIPVPITIARGAETVPAYGLISDAAMQILPGPHHVIAGAGHFWPEDDVEGFCALVDAWAVKI